MRWMLLVLAAAALAACVSTDNPDFRSDSPSGFGSSTDQDQRGSSTFVR